MEYAEPANDLAMLLRDLKRMDEAKVLAARAVETRRQLLGDAALPLAESLNTLATVQAMSGDYASAVPMFERATAIHESRPGPERETEEYGTLCINLAGTYQRIGKYTAAEAAFEKGLEALRVKPGVQHPAYAASLLAVAALKVDLGRYAEAERLYDEGARLVRAELGEQHFVYSTLLNNRGFFYQTIGNAAAAEADYRRSLELKRTLFGPNSPATISSLRNLAHLTYARDHRAGETLLAEAVEAYAHVPTPPAFEFTSVLVGLARAQRARGAITEARGTVTRALDVSRAGLGERHPLFASATRELGLTSAAAGQYDLAAQQLREALRIAEEIHGPRHPDVAAFLDALGDFYVERRDYPAAEGLFARSLDIQDRFSADVLDIGSESFKTASMATAADPIPRLIAFQTLAAAPLPDARVLAFEAVAARKGRLVEHVRNWRRRLDESASAAVQREVGEWHAILECRTSLTVALGYRDLKPGLAGTCSLNGTDLEGRYERLLSDLRSRWTTDIGTKAVEAIGVLEQRANRLEASLNRETAGLSGRPARPSVANLRGQLADDEALVEFVAFSEGPPSGGGPISRRYGAFVLTRSALGWTDLGSARPDRRLGFRSARRRTRLVAVDREPRGRGGEGGRANRTPRDAGSVGARVAADQAVARCRAERPASAHCTGRRAQSRAVRGSVRWTRSDRSLRDQLCACQPGPPGPLVSDLVGRAGRGCQSGRRGRQRAHGGAIGAGAARTDAGASRVCVRRIFGREAPGTRRGRLHGTRRDRATGQESTRAVAAAHRRARNRARPG